MGNEGVVVMGGAEKCRGEWKTRQKKSSWKREDEGWRKGRVKQEKRGRGKGR